MGRSSAWDGSLRRPGRRNARGVNDGDVPFGRRGLRIGVARRRRRTLVRGAPVDVYDAGPRVCRIVAVGHVGLCPGQSALGATPVNATVPLPLDAEAIRQALNSADPAVALAVALVAFHSVTSRQVRSLTLTDIIDGRLTLDGRDIPLPSPVRVRLTAWLDYRGRTWPGSINEHLSSAGRNPRAWCLSVVNSLGKKQISDPRLCVKTASSKRSTPTAVTSDGSAISSASWSRRQPMRDRASAEPPSRWPQR